MNSKNSKTSDSHTITTILRLLLDVIEKINSRRSDKRLLYQILVYIIYTWKTPCIRSETVNRST